MVYISVDGEVITYIIYVKGDKVIFVGWLLKWAKCKITKINNLSWKKGTKRKAAQEGVWVGAAN